MKRAACEVVANTERERFDGEKDEAMELALLCIWEVDDRKAVGYDRMELCLDQFSDQGHGRRVSSPNDTTDAMHWISSLWEDGIEMSIPPTVLGRQYRGSGFLFSHIFFHFSYLPVAVMCILSRWRSVVSALASIVCDVEPRLLVIMKS